MSDVRLLSDVQAEAARIAHRQAIFAWAEAFTRNGLALLAAVRETLTALHALSERASEWRPWYDMLWQAAQRVDVANAQVKDEPWKSWVAHALCEGLPTYTVPDDIPESVVQRTNEWLVAWQALQDVMEDLRAAVGEVAA